MRNLRSQRGSITIIAMAVVLVILVGFIAFKIAHKNSRSTQANNKSNTTTSKKIIGQPKSSSNNSDTKPPDLPTIQKLALNSRNVARKNDASALLSTVNMYSYNNNGRLPSTLYNSLLYGEPEGGQADNSQPLPKLQHYNSGTVSLEAGGKAAVASDIIVIVTRANCAYDDSSFVSSTRNFVVQYGLEQSDGTFKPVCQSN